MKSSSVHYHFPTKEALAAAVIRRYTDDVAKVIARGFEKESDPIVVWTRAFRSTIHSKDRICPCAVLGAASRDLPREVAKEVDGFFTMCLDNLQEKGLSREKASELLATIRGPLKKSSNPARAACPNGDGPRQRAVLNSCAGRI